MQSKDQNNKIDASVITNKTQQFSSNTLLGNTSLAQLWLCLSFPKLPLERLTIGWANPISSHTVAPAAQDMSLIICDQEHVKFTNALAHEAGIRVGMSLATAHTLDSKLIVIPRKIEEEENYLRQLADWAYQFTPYVNIANEYQLLLEIRGSLLLFKGFLPLLQRIADSLKKLSIHCQAGLAHTAAAAKLLGNEKNIDDLINEYHDLKYDDKRLHIHYFMHQVYAISIDKLPINAKQKQRLSHIGLSNIGELYNLSRSSIGERYGQGLLLTLDHIEGRNVPILPFIQPAKSFIRDIYFIDGISEYTQLIEPMQHLLNQLSQFLTQHQKSCRQLLWRFSHTDGKQSDLKINLQQAHNNANHFLSLTKIRIENYRIHEVIERIQIIVKKLENQHIESGQLFNETLNHQKKDGGFLLDKLSNHLGNECLHVLHLKNEHLPELKQTAIRIKQTKHETYRKTNSLITQQSSRYPVWLLQKPIPLKIRNHILWHKQEPLYLLTNAERITGHWWKHHDKRDYFMSRNSRGNYYWVFLDLDKRTWFLHGIFG